MYKGPARFVQTFSSSTRVIHALERVGDITEVFDKVRQLQHTGVLVRAAKNRSLDPDSERLWARLEAQPISFKQEIDLPENLQAFCPQGSVIGAILSS